MVILYVLHVYFILFYFRFTPILLLTNGATEKEAGRFGDVCVFESDGTIEASLRNTGCSTVIYTERH